MGFGFSSGNDEENEAWARSAQERKTKNTVEELKKENRELKRKIRFLERKLRQHEQ